MPKVDIWSRLTPHSQRAVEISRARKAAFTTTSTDPLRIEREAYRHERRYWNSFTVELADVRDLHWPTTHGPVPLRLYRPSRSASLPVLLFSHGGGGLGNLDTHDRICRLLARKSGWAVLAVDYALAPEHKFPVPQEQVLQVAQQVAHQGPALGLDASRLALGGDSTGARLSLAATLDARAQAGGPSIAALLLYYGPFGLRDSVSHRLYGWHELDGMGDEDMPTYHGQQYRREQDRIDPRSNLLANSMSGMPPMFIAGVTYDRVRDDSVLLAEYLKASAVPHRLRLYEGVLHSFLHHSVVEPLAMQAIEDGAAFLNENL